MRGTSWWHSRWPAPPGPRCPVGHHLRVPLTVGLPAPTRRKGCNHGPSRARPSALLGICPGVPTRTRLLAAPFGSWGLCAPTLQSPSLVDPLGEGERGPCCSLSGVPRPEAHRIHSWISSRKPWASGIASLCSSFLLLRRAYKEVLPRRSAVPEWGHLGTPSLQASSSRTGRGSDVLVQVRKCRLVERTADLPGVTELFRV